MGKGEMEGKASVGGGIRRLPIVLFHCRRPWLQLLAHVATIRWSRLDLYYIIFLHRYYLYRHNSIRVVGGCMTTRCIEPTDRLNKYLMLGHLGIKAIRAL